MTANIMEAAVELRALLAQTKLRLDEVLSMQIGDVITTDVNANDPVVVQAHGRNLFDGHPGHLRGVRSIEVTKTHNAGGAES